MDTSSLTDYQQSRILADEGKWETALEKIRLCLSREPENRKYQKLFNEISIDQKASLKIQEGKKLEQSGHFQQAIDIYRSAMEVKSRYHKQLKNLIKETKQIQQEFDELSKQAQQYYQQEKYTKAKSVIHELLKITPTHPAINSLIQQIEDKERAHILYGEAMALYKRGLFKPALEKVDLSLELDKDFAAAQILLARVHASKTCKKYELSDEWKHKKHFQKTIQLLEGSVEPDED